MQCALVRKMRASVQRHAVRFSSLISPECKFVGLLQCTLGLLQLTGCVHCSVRQRVYWRTPRRRDTNPGAPRLHLPSLGYSPGPVSCAALCTEQMPRPWQEPLSRGRGNTNSSIMKSKLSNKQAREGALLTLSVTTAGSAPPG